MQSVYMWSYKSHMEMEPLSSDVTRIWAYEKQLNPTASIPIRPITASDLDLGLTDFDEIRENLHLHDLPDLMAGLGIHDEGPPSQSSFDYYMDKERQALSEMHDLIPKLDRLPDVMAPQVARSTDVKDFIFELYYTLRDYLYKYDPSLARNLKNKWARRLISYYKHIEWGEYKTINVGDGWKRLMQLALVLMPDPEECELRRLNAYIDLLRGILTKYDFAKKLAPKSLSFMQGRGSEAMIRLQLQIKQQMDTLKELLDLRKNRSNPTVMHMRFITVQIIHHCSEYFLSNPRDKSVALLKAIAFGNDFIEFHAEKMNWLRAIQQLPDAVLSGSSPLWKEALDLAGAVSHYDPYGTKFFRFERSSQPLRGSYSSR